MIHLSIAWKLREIAELLKLQGESKFKIKAYLQAATNLEELSEDLSQIYQEKRLTAIPGIGKSISNHIEEILNTGDSSYLRELQKKTPISELLFIPGMSTKLAAKIYNLLGITTLTELQAAIEAHKIRELPGLNNIIENSLMKGIKHLTKRSKTALLGIALPLGDELIKRLKIVQGVSEIVIVGEARRYLDSISKLKLLAKSTIIDKLLDVFTHLPECLEIINRGENDALIMTRQGIAVELNVALPEQFHWQLFNLTGKKVHVDQIKNLYEQQEYSFNDGYCFDQFGTKLTYSSEAEIYKKIGLPMIIPELREGTDEILAAQRRELPVSVELTQIKGDLHLHTRWSDGVNTIEEMVDKAIRLGYQYIAISDHSRSLKIAKGMSIEVLEEQIKTIDELNFSLKDFQIFKGIEVDILKDGQLDYPDEVLRSLDLVVASIHSYFDGSEREMTERLILAIKNPHVNIIAHPTGRMLERYPAYKVDLEKVIKTAKEYGKILEVNSTPDRLDLPAQYLKICKDYGVKVAINTDAHSVNQMEYMKYGVGIARRGWLEELDVINTYPFDKLLPLLGLNKL